MFLFKAWVDCLVLEQVHHAFHGLRRSLIANQEQWREYFQVHALHTFVACFNC
ncbi:hypothetical protein DPMN_059080 [Dreissena polymorpha]|uniref:Uncharacterized protein n=1 Tax=Dreissena polymorpha TaxID=45954 RepID=A0A9D4HG79_DREPO|nr:hypothetical protein DPMN_059080 [Dreissena polymorpha]